MIGSTGLVFVDTNVLVYFRDSTEPEKQRRAGAWMAHLWDSGRGRLSMQVLREYYVVVTQKLDPGLPRDEAREDVTALQAWNPLRADLQLLDEAWAIEDRYGLSFWDGAIVAAAGRLGCKILLSEDLQDGQELGRLVVRNPFRYPPPAGT